MTQKKLFVISWYSLQANIFTLQSINLIQRNLLVVTEQIYISSQCVRQKMNSWISQTEQKWSILRHHKLKETFALFTFTFTHLLKFLYFPDWCLKNENQQNFIWSANLQMNFGWWVLFITVHSVLPLISHFYM